MAITMDGIFVNGQKVTFHPENILSGDASAYTEEIGTAVEEWLEENVTGGEQVTDTTLTLPGVPADAEVTGNKIEELKEDLNAMNTATSSDVGMALKVKTVENGKVTEWEFGESGSEITVPVYSASTTYPVGSYVMYDCAMYRSNVPISTAETWTAAHWDEITVSDLIADMNDRLDMVVTMQEIEQPAPPAQSSQLVHPEDITWVYLASKWRAKVAKTPLDNDGTYYPNPARIVSGDVSEFVAMYSVGFYDAYDQRLTLTKQSDQSTVTTLTLFSGTYGAYITIKDKRTIKLYSRYSLAATYTANADIAYMGGPDAYIAYPSSDTAQVGITYEEQSNSYIPYSGSEPPVPEYEWNYTISMAQFVEEYMKVHGTAATNNMFNFLYPEKGNSEFVNAVKYYHDRADRQKNNVIRFGTFNKFVSRGRSNWPVIKQELADYSVDICGFQECAAITSEGVVTDQIGAYLQGWQYGGYAVQDATVDKAIVSHWEVTHTDLITLLTYDNSGTSNCIHAIMTIPANKWYSNAVSADATLSVYSYHGTSTGKTIGGVSYSSYQVRQMEISALLAILAQDTADFIVIVGDTNAFETGFDIPTGTHHEWEMFRTAGFTPVLDGHDSTVAADLEDKYFCKADNDEVFCIASYDQIFVGANISVERFGVVDSNLYPVEALGDVPVSDHCMVYADLKFDFDSVQQAKLEEIAITTPWW